MQLFTFVMIMMMLMLMVVPSTVQLAANRERAAAAHPSAPRHDDCWAGFAAECKDADAIVYVCDDDVDVDGCAKYCAACC